MAAFNKEYPKVTFTLIKCDSGQVIKHLEEGVADFGLTGSVESGSNCDFVAFAKDPLVIVTPNKDPFTTFNTFSGEMLIQFPFINRESQSGTRRGYENYLSTIGIPSDKLNVIATMDSVDGIKSSITSGLGISIMSALSVEEFKQLGLLKTFTLDDMAIPRNLYIAKLKHKTLSQTAKNLVTRVKHFTPKDTKE